MISAFVASYGYLAIFIGTLLEGETVLIAAGFAAHRGLLDGRLVVVVAMLGATLGDQLAFLLGRWKGAALIERFPALARQKPRIDDLLQRYNVIFILSVRFLYGLRIAGPVLLGSSGMAVLRFALLNAIGAALWAAVVTGAGYAFGVAINALVADLKVIEEVVLVLIVVCGLSFWLWRRLGAWKR
ncbi:MAG: DedA family protein [Candidatus Accumulibacter phosphatis]|uniref:DedA family protein n=1 Tax=Candidatus Accumulibacter phosphatis TaxID=327160 RepID=A0A6A7RSS7_9PROT|nr:DedA family protein [Candidatus Accumulibacter phosphatis]